MPKKQTDDEFNKVKKNKGRPQATDFFSQGDETKVATTKDTGLKTKQQKQQPKQKTKNNNNKENSDATTTPTPTPTPTLSQLIKPKKSKKKAQVAAQPVENNDYEAGDEQKIKDKSKGHKNALESISQEFKQIGIEDKKSEAKNNSNVQHLTADEKKEIIINDSKELLTLLEEFNTRIKEIRSHIGPLIERVKKGELETRNGISFLEIKLHLLLSYCIDLCFIIFKKCEGKESIYGHGSVQQLVQIRVILDKIRPVDAKLKYQIDKLLKMASSTALQEVSTGTRNSSSVTKDPLMYKPNPLNMASKIDSEDEGDVYKIPKMNPVDFLSNESQAKKVERAQEKLSQRVRNSAAIRSLQAEMSSGPEEMKSIGADLIGRTDKERRELNEIDRFEEENMMRLQYNKKLTNAMKRKRESYVDELADLANLGAGVLRTKALRGDGEDDDFASYRQSIEERKVKRSKANMDENIESGSESDEQEKMDERMLDVDGDSDNDKFYKQLAKQHNQSTQRHNTIDPMLNESDDEISSDDGKKSKSFKNAGGKNRKSFPKKANTGKEKKVTKKTKTRGKK